jgi:hypothetical protein
MVSNQKRHTSRKKKATAWVAVAFGLLVSLAEVVNTVSAEHTVAHKLTDQLLCAVFASHCKH